MRTKLIVIGSSALLAFGAALAQDAPKPGPEQKALGYFAGKWTSEGEMKPGPFGPGGKMTSVDTCEWFAGGFQLVCRGQGSGAMGSMTTLGVIGYSPTEKSYTFYGIDSMGMNDYSKGKKSGNTWTFTSKSEMNGKAFHSRYTMVEGSPTSYTFKWDMSEDGTKWATVMEGKSTKKTEWNPIECCCVQRVHLLRGRSRMRFFAVSLCAVAVSLSAAVLVTSPAAATEAPPHACYSGAYKLTSGDCIIISPSDEGALRYRVPDGRSGRLYPDDDRHFHGGPGWASREPRIVEAVFDACPGKRLEFRLKDGPSGVAQRVPVAKTPTTFSSIGNTLYGELYVPEKPQALVVLVFGSGQDSAVTWNYVQHLLPMYGIAAFVYDKRGTGKSTGRFTVDFSELADDALAAVAHARKLLNAPAVPVGLMGESQGGWIAPLAAVRAPADFVVVSYGLAISPLEEDREEVKNELRAKHYDDRVLAKGRELTDITGRILLSRFTDGLEDLRKFKAAHADQKWLKEVEGDFTGPLLRSPDEQFEELRSALGFDAILDYDAQAALRRVRTPMLWIVAGKDTEAPPAPTLEFLRTLQAAPPQLDIAVFPNADHGMIEDDRESAGYHDLLAAWIRTRKLEGKFGTAVLQPDRTP